MSRRVLPVAAPPLLSLLDGAMLRILVYLYTFPTTLPGLLLALGAGRWQWVDGVLEVSGGLVAFALRHAPFVGPGGASAMTLGHVVLGLDPATLARTRSHERVHVRQAQLWGPLFLPAYLLAGAWQTLQGRDCYRDNPFEVEAYRKAP